MRELLINIAPYLIWFLAITELILFIVSIKKAKNVLNILSAAVCFGLAVDALIQAFGIIIGEGSFLKFLSQIRFILHGILVPLLIPIAFYTFNVKKRNTKIVIFSITSIFMILGIIMGILTKTEPILFAKVLRYAQSNETISFAKTINTILSFGGVLPLIVVGIFHLIKNKSPFLLLSGLFMFIFSALGPATHNMDLNFLLTMIGEDIMVFFFAFELKRKEKIARQSLFY